MATAMFVVRVPWMKSTKMQVWRVAAPGLGLHWERVVKPDSVSVNELPGAPEFGLAVTVGWAWATAPGASTRAAREASIPAARPRRSRRVGDITGGGYVEAAAGASNSALVEDLPARRAERDEVAPPAPGARRVRVAPLGQAVESAGQPVA